MIIAAIGSTHRSIVDIMRLVAHRDLAAIAVILHIHIHITHIVGLVLRCTLDIACRIVIPIIRRTPRRIVIATQRRVDHRCTNNHRLDDIIGTIEIRRTDHLDIARTRHRYLRRQGSNILEVVGTQHRLDIIDMSITRYRLQHTQIINETITIEVEVGEIVRTMVDQILKLLHRLRLDKRRSNGLQIQRLGIRIGGLHHYRSRGNRHNHHRSRSGLRNRHRGRKKRSKTAGASNGYCHQAKVLMKFHNDRIKICAAKLRFFFDIRK